MKTNIILTYADRPQEMFDLCLPNLNVDFKKSMLENALFNLDKESFNNLVKLSACFECDYETAIKNKLTKTALKCNAKLYFENGKVI